MRVTFDRGVYIELSFQSLLQFTGKGLVIV